MTFRRKWQIGCAVALVVLLTIGWVYGRGSTVATINGKAISKQEFYKALEEQNGSQILGELILKSLVEQQARREGVNVSSEELDEEVASVQQRFQSEYEFQLALMQYGMTFEQFKEETRYSLLLEKLRTNDIIVTDKEVQDYYEANKESYVIPVQYKISHIMVSKEDVAKNIVAQLEDGKDFAILANENTEDAQGKDNGGDLGYFEENTLPEVFKDEVLKLKAGQTTEVIKSQYGYHIVRLTEKLDAKQLAFDEVKSHAERLVKLKKAVSESDYIRQLRENAKITIIDKTYKDLLS
jgi:foldase protein PrsA